MSRKATSYKLPQGNHFLGRLQNTGEDMCCQHQSFPQTRRWPVACRLVIQHERLIPPRHRIPHDLGQSRGKVGASESKTVRNWVSPPHFPNLCPHKILKLTPTNAPCCSGGREAGRVRVWMQESEACYFLEHVGCWSVSPPTKKYIQYPSWILLLSR